MNELTLIDTFSGIGGFSLAGDWAGFRTVCFSEVDPYASAVLRKHWPDVPNLGDITKADFTPYAGATVLTGGFPCQPFSTAGKQRGKDDDRFLWPAMLRAIRESRPTWIVGENVNGFVGMGLSGAKSDLEGEGYKVRPFIIPACAVGADHRRDRVWIVAHLDGVRKLQPGGIIQDERGRALPRDYKVNAGALRVGLSTARQHQKSESAKTENRLESAVAAFPGRDTYPALLRKVYGIPRRMDRIKSLGNAIVPQVAFEILSAIAAIEMGEVI